MNPNLLTVIGAATGLLLLTLFAARATAAEPAMAGSLIIGTTAATTVSAEAPAATLREARTRRELLVRRLAPAFQIVP